MPVPQEISERLDDLREALEGLDMKLQAVETLVRQLVIIEPATRALRHDFTSIQMAVKLLARDVDRAEAVTEGS